MAKTQDKLTPEQAALAYRNGKLSALLGNIFTLIDDMEQWIGEQDGEWKDNLMPVEAAQQRMEAFVVPMRKHIETARDLVK